MDKRVEEAERLARIYNVSSEHALRRLLLRSQKTGCCPLTEGIPRVITPDEEALLAAGVPIQKIIGHTHFGNLIIQTHRHIFLPRLETYEVAIHALAVARQMTVDLQRPIHILDLCCGTGVLGLFLKYHLRDADVTLVDIAPEAVATARETAWRHNLSVTIYQGDLYDPLPLGSRYDLIVANPPYLALNTHTDDISLSYEPAEALWADEDGMSLYRRILAVSSCYLTPTGRIIFEISDEVAPYFLSAK